MASATLNEPSRRFDTKAAEAADDQMRACGVDLELAAPERLGRASERRRAHY